MNFVWDEHYWLARQGWAYGDGDTRWAAFWDCVRCILGYAWIRVCVHHWPCSAVWHNLFRWEEAE